jgi:hypothetical protein
MELKCIKLAMHSFSWRETKMKKLALGLLVAGLLCADDPTNFAGMVMMQTPIAALNNITAPVVYQEGHKSASDPEPYNIIWLTPAAPSEAWSGNAPIIFEGTITVQGQKKDPNNFITARENVIIQSPSGQYYSFFMFPAYPDTQAAMQTGTNTYAGQVKITFDTTKVVIAWMKKP